MNRDPNIRVYYDRMVFDGPDGKKVRQLTGITVVSIFDGDKVHIGVSRCSEDDNINKRLGRSIALGRAQNQQDVYYGRKDGGYACKNGRPKSTTSDSPIGLRTEDAEKLRKLVTETLDLPFQLPMHMLARVIISDV